MSSSAAARTLARAPIASDRERAFELARATGRELVGLRDFVVDPLLFLYVPQSLALRERVVPLAVRGDTLELAAAAADPDLSTVTASFPELEVKLFAAAEDEVLAALNAAAARTG